MSAVTHHEYIGEAVKSRYCSVQQKRSTHVMCNLREPVQLRHHTTGLNDFHSLPAIQQQQHRQEDDKDLYNKLIQRLTLVNNDMMKNIQSSKPQISHV